MLLKAARVCFLFTFSGPGQFGGGPKSVPISNGPHAGPVQGQFGSGPQGDQGR